MSLPVDNQATAAAGDEPRAPSPQQRPAADPAAPAHVGTAQLHAIRESLRELFSPLSVVVGFSDLLRDDALSDEERRHRADLVYAAGRELEKKLRRALAEVQGALDREGGSQLDLI